MLPEAVSVSLKAPLWQTSGWQENISVTSYRHNLLSMGGYWSAQFGLTGGLEALEEWVDIGLGRHVEVRNGALDIIWEGFVNQVDATIGRLTLNMGQLMDVANIVDLVFSTVDTSGPGRPQVGIRDNTGAAENTDSQERWGIHTKILSSGGVNVDLAPQIRDIFLSENFFPPKQQTFKNESKSEPTLSIQCLGYYHWLDYVYNQKVTTGDGNSSVKIIDILTGIDAETGNPYNLNSNWLTFGIMNIDENLTQIKLWEEKDKLAKTLVDNAAMMGDPALNRWLLGIYANREVHYHQAPTEVEYIQRITGTPNTIFTTQGTEVFPWDTKPGKWMLFPDFMSTRRHPDNLREDPRAMFIESIDYTAPYTVSAQGGHTARLDQLLAQLGLSGVGA